MPPIASGVTLLPVNGCAAAGASVGPVMVTVAPPAIAILSASELPTLNATDAGCEVFGTLDGFDITGVAAAAGVGASATAEKSITEVMTPALGSRRMR